MNINDLKGNYKIVGAQPLPTSTTTPTQAVNKVSPSITKPVETPTPDYFSRVGNAYNKAGQDIMDSSKSTADSLLTPGASLHDEFSKTGHLLQTGLRTTGAVANAAFSPVTEAPVIKQGLEGIGSLISKIPGVQHIIDNASELAQRHPELAKDIKNIVDIATLVAPTSNVVQKGTNALGTTIENGAIKAADSQKGDFLRSLLSPEQTKAVKEAQVGRTSETGIGIFKKSVIAPTDTQIAAEKAVSTIPGIKPANTVQQNFNIIRDANTQAAKDLEASVQQSNFIIPKKEISSRLSQAAANLKKSPVIVGDSEKTAQKLLDGATEIINKNPGTGSGLLAARKEYDNWVLAQKPKAFDAASENAFTLANREIRSTFNTLLDEKAPTLGVKASLRHQNSLYNAMDTLVPKAAKEADSAIGRSLQKIGAVLGTKNKIVQATAAGVGIGGLGAAATFAPVVAGLGIPTYVIYKAGKFVLKPSVRKALGKALQNTAKPLKDSDRIVIQGLLDQYSD